MANEFVIKNGFESKGDSAVTGSLIVSYNGAGTLQLTTTSSQVYSEKYGPLGVRSIGVSGIVRTEEISSPGDTPILVGGRFVTSFDGEIGGAGLYSLWLQDGTEAAGKVLVSQTADGLANWSTRLSGSYDLTGSLKITGSSELSSSIHVTVSSGSSRVNMGVGVSKFIPFTYLADQTNIYTDKYIQISYDTSGTDPELTILTGPTSGRIQVHLFNSATAAESTIDMLTSTLTDIFSTGLLTDTRLDCTISAGSDLNWPFYRMTWFRSNTTYGGNIQVLIERFYK